MDMNMGYGIRVGLVVVFLLSAGGCGDDDSGPKYTVREGIALKVNEKGQVSMRFVTDKGLTITRTGDVDEDAEIWIDGKQARLKDVRKGDHIKATIRVEGSKLDKHFVVTRIEVERSEFEATSKPATTQPVSTQPAKPAGASTSG